MSGFSLENYRVSGKLRRFTNVGCYPLFYVTRKCGVLCAECAGENDYQDDPVDGAEVNWEAPDLYCDACSQRIESAYAEDEVQS